MDLACQKHFKEVEITTRFHRSRGLEKSHQENSIQLVLAWKQAYDDDDGWYLGFYLCSRHEIWHGKFFWFEESKGSLKNLKNHKY